MYQQFFGLEDEPFRLTPDPRFLFLSPKHAEALAHLRLGLTESSGFVCITGDVGTGKTTLLRAFLSELGPNVAAAYTFVPPLSALELLRRICREFGLTVSDRSPDGLVDDLHAYLVAQHQAGRVCVVVLDEAQALSIELLEQIRLLLNLETETQKLLRIVLVGQPQLRQLLLDPDLAQLNQRITLRWHLGPLSYRETAAYVSHRLAVASGGRPSRLFTRPALRLLYSVSGGVPRLINMVAHRAMLAAFVAREKHVTRRLVARAYREIQAVPLPGTLSPARKAALAVVGLAIGIALVAFGGTQLDRLLNLILPASKPERVRETRIVDAQDAGRAAPALVQVSDPPMPTPPAAKSAATLALAATGGPPVAEPIVLSAAELTRRLSSVDEDTSVRTATDVVLAAWGERPLVVDESRLPDDLPSVAWRRGLQELTLTSNRSMLRLLDLPALLALRIPGAKGVRYAAVTGMDPGRAALSIDGQPTILDAGTLDQFWSGQAYIFWRDFEGLGPSLSRGASGTAVTRLQQLLSRVGVLRGKPTGVFEIGTETAVLDFQGAHLLDRDGVVGPLTRIVLYGAAGNFPRPTLTIHAQAAS